VDAILCRKPTKMIEGHQGRINRLAVTYDRHHILSASSDHTARLWDGAKGECLRSFEGHDDEVTGVAFVPGGKLAVSGSRDGTLCLWDLETGETVRVFYDEGGQITSLAVTPDGKSAVSGSEAGYLRLWDLESGRCQKVFDRHPVCWDMRFLIQGSNREFSYNDVVGNYALAQTYDPENRTFFGHADALTALAVSPCGRYLISGSRDCTVRLWNLGSGKCLWIFGGHDGEPGFWINDVAVSSNGRQVLTLTNRIQAWKLSSKAARRHSWGLLGEKPVFVIADEAVSGSCLAVIPGGRSVVVTTDGDRTVSLYQLRTRKRRRVFDLENEIARSIAVVQDGSFLAVGTHEGTIALFELR
jgi:WD40 repeat protein